MFQALDPLTEGITIMGRDANTAFDTGLDKSKSSHARLIRPSKASVQIARLIFQSRLADFWRGLNPSIQD